MSSINKKNVKERGVSKKLRNITVISSFFGLLKKNLKIILRSRNSAMIILLGPLIIIFLVGAAFNTSSLFNIQIGAYSSSYSKLADSLIQELGDKQFNVQKLNSQEECISKLKNNEVHVCAVFPPDLQVGSEGNIEFFVDNSKINLVWVIIDSLSTKVSTKSSELSLQLANNLLSTLSETDAKLSNEKGSIDFITTKNDDLEKKFNEALLSLNNLDLSFSVSLIGVDKISNKLDSVIKSNNYNKSLFTTVDDAIRNSIKEAKDYEKTVNATEATKNKLVTDLTDATGILDESKTKIKGIEGTINEINTNINNAKSTSAESIAIPIKTKISPVAIEKTHLNFLFPTLVVLIIMFIGLLLSSILVVREKTSSAYFRNFITPTKDWLFILSDYVTNLIIVLIQLGIIFAVALYFFKESLLTVVLNSFIIVLLLSTLFIFLGMLIGYLFKSEETVVLATFSLGSLFLFFSGTILPLETLPEYIRSVADLNPFVLGEGILKKIMLFNLSFSELGFALQAVLIYIAVLGAGVYFARKLSKRAI
ncbi:ABC transporter permease [Candidatus Woesearchaeota archaeon]|nr:ABC transporter permease [Candidatus Woesearchaeota archaeon]